MSAQERIADAYLTAAWLSTTTRTKRDAQQYRYQSRGLLMALEILLGSIEDACRLIEARRGAHANAHYQSIDALLYEFWTLDRPRVLA